jgi:hypothetical protein
MRLVCISFVTLALAALFADPAEACHRGRRGHRRHGACEATCATTCAPAAGACDGQRRQGLLARFRARRHRGDCAPACGAGYQYQESYQGTGAFAAPTAVPAPGQRLPAGEPEKVKAPKVAR